MANVVRGCTKLARAGLTVGRRGLSSAKCEPCDVGVDLPKVTGIGKSTQEGKDCGFDFKKREIWPYEDPCGCTDAPPPSGCQDVGQPRQVCCRSVRQYGCHCEEEDAEECEEEPEPEPAKMECSLDFKKKEVNPYDESCECRDTGAATSCDTLNKGQACCRSSLPFGCECDSYDKPALDCVKQKAAPAQKKKKECNSKRPGPKCL